MTALTRDDLGGPEYRNTRRSYLARQNRHPSCYPCPSSRTSDVRVRVFHVMLYRSTVEAVEGEGSRLRVSVGRDPRLSGQDLAQVCIVRLLL